MVQYVVEEVRYTTPGVMVLTLRAEDARKSILFLPGQYAAINFFTNKRPTAVRCFSLASDPNTPDIVQFGIRVGGRYTTRLSKITPGEIIELRGPYGGFVLDRTTHKSVVFLAGGIGITPFLSMIRHATSVKDSTAIKLLFSVRTQDDISFQAELEELAANNPNFELCYVVSDGATDKLTTSPIYTGFLTKEMLTPPKDKSMAETTFFLCGPPPYMNAAIKNLKELGVPSRRIITEAFSQGNGGGTRRVHSMQLNAYTLSGLSFAALAITFFGQDIVRTLPSQLLSDVVDDDALKRTKTARQADIDALIASYSLQAGAAIESPSLVAANQAVKDAQAQIDAQRLASSGSMTTYTAPTRTTTAPSATSSAPAPVVTNPTPTPTCTTSPSGVTTCQ